MQRTADCRLPTAHCSLPPAACPLPPAHCSLPPAHCSLPPAACLLPPAACRLPTLLALAVLLLAPLHAQTKPNVLLITIDTLRADRLGSYGYARARTPVLDALAREGVRFEKAFSPAPLTLPAHASILTGVYPSTHGIRDNSGFLLSPDQTTLAEVLKKSGYATSAFVGAFVLDSKFGLDQGFDTYFDNFDLSRYENISPGYIQHRGDKVIGETIRWLEANRRRPFFTWVHLYDPHDPYAPPEPYASRHRGRSYDGEIEFTDANVGKLFDWLKSAALYESTLIVVVGDHGESLGEHGEDKHGYFIYNATLHVPMLVRFPAARNGGRTIAQNVSSIDLAPTVLQILGIERAALPLAQGSGLLSLMLGKDTASRPAIYAESYYPRLEFGWSQLRALISGNHKYILAPRPELYDLAGDFAETNNLNDQNASLANRLRADLQGLVARTSSEKRQTAGRPPTDPETIEKLKSLGYVALSMGDAGTENFQALSDPKDQLATYNEIVALFELGSRSEFARVIPRYREILKSQPNLKLVRYKLAQAHFHSADYPAALDEFKKVIALEGGDQALAIFDLAQTYMKLNRIEDAIVGFQQTIKADPSHHRARTNLGVLYKNQGRIPEAIAELEKAVALAPNSVFALGNLGVAYSLAGQPEKGVEILKRAIGLSPENALLYANLSIVYRRMGRAAEAEKQLEIARRLNPRLRLQ